MPITDAVRPYMFKPGHSGNPHGGHARRAELYKMCKKMGFEPLVEAINRYRDPKTPNASKDFCLGLVVDRLYPKLKSVEVRTDQTNAQQVLINIVAGDQQVTQEHPQPQVGIELDHNDG